MKGGALGISIDQSHLRLARMVDGALAWVLEAEIADPSDPAPALAELLARAPGAPVAGSAAAIAFASPLAQVRTISGLPSAMEDAAAIALLRESPHRWFLARPGGLTISGIVRDDHGEIRAAAYPRSNLDGVAVLLRARGIRLRSVTTYDAATRVAADLPDHLSRTGDGAHPFAASVGAALLAASGQAAPFEVPQLRERPATVTGWRARAASVAFAIALAGAVLAFPAAVLGANGDLARREATTSVARGPADSLVERLAAVRGELEAIRDRSRSRISFISTIEAIRSALPSDVAVVSFRADSASGTITVIGNRVGSVPDRLAESGMVRAPRFVGPVTAEAVGGTLLERATVSFVSLPSGSRP
ncbi:MAG: hypothetical protein IPJ78_10925 [Gemmatimonadetes bacterium]|nr:hypothetical protein [Gemmatimonadota bacterium]